MTLLPSYSLRRELPVVECDPDPGTAPTLRQRTFLETL